MFPKETKIYVEGDSVDVSNLAKTQRYRAPAEIISEDLLRVNLKKIKPVFCSK